jgi:dynein heavy chain
MLDEWLKLQRTWLYLEPIFGSEDIIRQLPRSEQSRPPAPSPAAIPTRLRRSESRRFNDVDKVWRKTMSEARNDPNFLVIAHPDKRLGEIYKAANEKCEKVCAVGM